MNAISIVIVTYNSTKDIIGCLDSIYKNNDIGCNLEIIIVDNNSSDINELQSILHSCYPEVKLLRNSCNGGYGQGNNIGIKSSTSPIILIMNPDVRLFFPIFKNALKIYSQDNNLSLLGMTQFEDVSTRSNSYLPLNESILFLLVYKFCKKFNIYSSNFLFISGACFFIRKDYFESIGLFDESIFLYGEEKDINYRIRRSKKTIGYFPRLGYIHPMHTREITLKILKSGFDSFIYTYKKFGFNIKLEIFNKILRAKLLRYRAKKLNMSNEVNAYTQYLSFLKNEYKKY